LPDFNGALFVKLYDSFLKRNAADYSYLMPGRVLFEDTLAIQNGKTDAHFFLRGDTLAGGKLGRIVAYAWEKRDQLSQSTGDASGHLDSLFIIADTLSATTKLDSIPPDVEIEINNTPVSQFSENDMYVDPSFVMDFYVRDEDSGINIGHGAGYEMTVQLDSSQDNSWDVTSDFVFDTGTNHSGHVGFEFENLLPGTHQILFSAWDNSLNRANVRVQVVVTPKNMQIIDPMTYPNPAPGYTAFTFSLTNDAQVTIKVYTVAGRLIRTLNGFASRGFNHFPEEDWDCTDEDGDFLANGLYLYKIIAQRKRSFFETEKENQRSERIGRMIVMR